jgi:hypothetical protein
MNTKLRQHIAYIYKAVKLIKLVPMQAIKTRERAEMQLNTSLEFD